VVVAVLNSGWRRPEERTRTRTMWRRRPGGWRRVKVVVMCSVGRGYSSQV
jgi:hypothetical protein